MSELSAKWVKKDSQSLEDGGSGSLQVKLKVDGGVIKDANGLQVSIDDSTIELQAGDLAVKDGGIVNSHIAAGAAIASSKLADGSRKRYTKTLDSTDITTNKYVDLGVTPKANSVVFEVKDAPIMFEGDDFSVSGTQVSWNGLAIDGILAVGDKVIVTYNA